MALPVTPHHLTVTVSILMMFYAALCQSEVVPQTKPAFDPLRHLTLADVAINSDNIKAAKNMQRFSQSRKDTVYAAEHQQLCVIHAVRRVIVITPTIVSNQSMFVFSGSNAPMTATSMRSQWQAALRTIGKDSKEFTLHGIRKAAVTTAFDEGQGEWQVQHFGGWASGAYKGIPLQKGRQAGGPPPGIHSQTIKSYTINSSSSILVAWHNFIRLCININ